MMYSATRLSALLVVAGTAFVAWASVPATAQTDDYRESDEQWAEEAFEGAPDYSNYFDTTPDAPYESYADPKLYPPSVKSLYRGYRGYKSRYGTYGGYGNAGFNTLGGGVGVSGVSASEEYTPSVPYGYTPGPSYYTDGWYGPAEFNRWYDRF